MKRNSLVACLSFLSGVLFIVGPLAANAEWTDLGLYGGQIYSIALDKNNTSKMFAGGYYGGGLFRTNDGGATWTPVTTGAEGGEFEGEATFRNTAVWGVEIAPSNSNVVWVVHNYWAEKSSDGGATWTHILNSTMQGSQFRWCKSLAIDPAKPNIVYVGAAGPGTDTLTMGTIYKTTDGGSTWNNIGPNTYSTAYGYFYRQFPYPIVDIAIDPQNSNNIYSISSSAEGAGAISYVYRSTDAGSSWTQIYTCTGGLKSIKVKPDDSTTVFVSGYNGIVKLTCSTSCSSSMVYSASGSDFRAIAFQQGAPGTLWVAGKGSYFGIYDIAGNSFTWVDIGYQLLSLAIKPLVIPTSGTVVFGGELHKGIIELSYSIATHQWTWRETNDGVNSIQVWDVAVNPTNNSHYLAATEAGLYEKASAAGGWTKIGNFDYTSAYAVAFDLPSTTTRYVGTEGRLYRSTDSGATWPSSIGLSGTVTDIAVAPSPSDYIYVTTRSTSYGHVYRVTKNLSSATNIKPTGNFDYNTVVIDPNDPGYDRIFVGGGNFFGTKVLGKIYETTNANGSPPTWTERLSNVIVNSLLMDPSDSNNMYAGAGWSGGADIPLYKSSDSGQTWQKSHQGIPAYPSRYGIWGNSATNLYVLRHTGSIPYGGTDDSYMIRYCYSDGMNRWKKEEIGDSTPLYAIWGYDSSNIFAVGQQGKIFRYNGTAWSASQQGLEDLHDVWGSSGSNVYAVGAGGTICHFNGIGWATFLTSPTDADLHGIWGSSATNIFAVGSSGIIWRYTGSWSLVPSPVTERLEDVWGSSSTDIFAVGSPRLVGSTRYHTILRWDGSSWTVMATPSVAGGKSGRLRSVWGSSGTDVFAVGDDGVILRYNGTSWSSMSSGTTDPLYGVWGTGSTNVYAVGLFGTIIRYNGTSWSAVETSGETSSGLIPYEKGYVWNAVTDLAFSPEGHIYAATNRQGIYASANGAKNWMNMSAPPYSVYAVAAGSVVSGGSAGTHTLSGEGLLYGTISDLLLDSGLFDAKVYTDVSGGRSTTTEADGSWAMLHPAGTFNVSASKTGYPSRTETSVPVYDGTWTSVTLALSNDVTPPSLNIGNPSTTVTKSGPVTYTVTYTNADTVSLANAHVTLHKTGTANGSVTVSGAGTSTRTVTISSITGDGAIGISIAAGSAADISGNLASPAGPSEMFTVDNTAPAIEIGSPSVILTRSGPVTYTVTYTGADLISLTNVDVTLNQTGTANGTVSVSGTGDTRTVTIFNISGNGTLSISIAGSASDAAGNFAQVTGPTLTFTVDNTAPSVAIGGPSASLTKSGPVTYTLTYTGADIVSLANAQVSLNKTGTANGTAAVSGTGTRTRTVTVLGIAGSGTIGISIAAGTASDTAGNLAPAGGPSEAFTVDPSVKNDYMPWILLLILDE